MSAGYAKCTAFIFLFMLENVVVKLNITVTVKSNHADCWYKMRCELVSPPAFVTAERCCATSAFVTDRGKYLLLQLQEGSCQENVNKYHFKCLNKDQCYHYHHVFWI